MRVTPGLVEFEMGIMQSQLKYKTLFSGLKFILGTREHGNTKSQMKNLKKEEIIKNI